MKSLKIIYYLLTLSIVMLLFGNSCNSQETKVKANTEYLQIEDFLVDLENIKNVPTGSGIFTKIEYNLQTKRVKIISTEIKEVGMEFVLFYMDDKESGTIKDRGHDEFKVTCSGGSGGDWDGDCDSKLSCGRLIGRCLDGGGCATICSPMILTVPEERRHFVILDY